MQRVLQIENEFESFDENRLFELTDGTLWIQDEYKYAYHYAYRPQVMLQMGNDGRTRLRVSGMADAVAAREVSVVTRSRINDEFHGWDGETEYELQNGQIWRQVRYKYKYKYSFAPEVLIYQDRGRHHIHVAGTTAEVIRKRLSDCCRRFLRPQILVKWRLLPRSDWR